MAGFRRVVDTLFHPRNLLWTNIGCSGLLMGLGDCTVQSIERYVSGPRKPHNWAQTGRMITIGLALGPFNHVWYTFLDKVLPGRSLLTLGRKILADQTVASPFFALTFFMGSSILEGEPLDKGWKVFTAKFWDVYKADWMVWPPAQLINFAFVPQRFRVLYVCNVTFCWDSILCYMKQQELPADGQVKTQRSTDVLSETTLIPATASQSNPCGSQGS